MSIVEFYREAEHFSHLSKPLVKSSHN